jgi:gliotoxin/aspirochlorine biosynthesis peptide synthetase
MDVHPKDRVFLVYSVAFDGKRGTRFCLSSSYPDTILAAFSGVLWSTLCNGGTLCLASKMDIAAVARTVTHLPVTPSLLSSLEPSEFQLIRLIFVGGEALPLQLVQSWAIPNRRIFNCYGPTETTCVSTMTEVGAGTQQVTIGKPLRGYVVFLVDEALKPVGLGCSGEILIGGVGVARGYLNNPEMTRERFVRFEWLEKGLGGDLCNVWYRTGDL